MRGQHKRVALALLPFAPSNTLTNRNKHEPPNLGPHTPWRAMFLPTAASCLLHVSIQCFMLIHLPSLSLKTHIQGFKLGSARHVGSHQLQISPPRIWSSSTQMALDPVFLLKENKQACSDLRKWQWKVFLRFSSGKRTLSTEPFHR